MYLTDVSMQLVSMLFVLIIGLYFFMLVFSFYRREKRRTREQDVRRYTYEYCTKEMNLLNKYTNNIAPNREDKLWAICKELWLINIIWCHCFIYFYNFIDSDFKFSSESSKRLD